MGRDCGQPRPPLDALGAGDYERIAAALMGRDCGQPRPPLDALGAGDYERIAAALGAMPALGGEPRNW